MNETYVSFEVAKFLKEKGFDWFTYAYYTKDDVDTKPYFGMENLCPDNWNGEVGEVNDLWFSVPTQQMACRWLREEYDIDIIPIIRHSLKYAQESPFRDYACRVYDSDGNIVMSATKWYSRYENAIEAALDYALKNLI